MNFIRKFINQETDYFKKLHSDGQKLLLSIFLYSLVSPILNLFLNAFLWRQSQDLILVAVFNLVLYLIIPVGFYLNGVLMKKFSPGLIYSLSLLLSSMAVAGLIFLPTISYPIVIVFGLLQGLFSGVYWATRNLLTLKTTQSDNRIYFSSLESATGTISGVIIPLFIGWFIAFGGIGHFYSPVQGYQMVALLMLLTLGIVGFVMKKISIKQSAVGQLVVKHASRNWQKFQAIQFIWGLNNGIVTFFPTLIILILVGNEGALGTVQSLSAVLTSVLLFALAKYLDIHHRLPLILSSAVLLMMGSVTFGLLYSAIGVLVFVACQALASSFEWVGFSSLNYDLIDKDGERKNNHYAYICDQEIYLNAGRVIAILLFIAIIHFGSKELALRFAPIIVAILQIFAYVFAKSINTHQIKQGAIPALNPNAEI